MPTVPWGSSSAGCPFSTCPWSDGRPPTLTGAPHPGSAFLWGQALLIQALPLVGGRALLTLGPEPGAPSAASQGNGGHPAWGVPEGGGVPSSPLGNPSFHLSPLFLTLAEESLFGGVASLLIPNASGSLQTQASICSDSILQTDEGAGGSKNRKEWLRLTRDFALKPHYTPLPPSCSSCDARGLLLTPCLTLPSPAASSIGRSRDSGWATSRRGVAASPEGAMQTLKTPNSS